jgi:type IV pilus assembly protein PilM
VSGPPGLAEAAGLTPVVLDIESHASRLAMTRVVSVCPTRGATRLVALFEIGADTTSLKVLRDEDMLYDRDQAFGGSQLTQLIARQYGFSFEEAEQKKVLMDLPDDYEHTSSRRLSTACRRRSGARCSTSSPARRTTRCTT